MLAKIFLCVLDMSYIASFVILFVSVLRLLLKNAPKNFSYSLWGVVLLRLICPYSFSSILSLLPRKASPIAADIFDMTVGEVSLGISTLNNVVNTPQSVAASNVSVNPLSIWVVWGSIIWVLGMAILFSYGIISLLQLHIRLKNGIHEKDNIYVVEELETAFVLGLFQPKIYLPTTLSFAEKGYILLHEQVHIERFDHVTRILSFLTLCLHWFNPFVWLAFRLSNRDMEMSCDEAVIKRLGGGLKKEYSITLLSLATGNRVPSGIPLAFGEGDTKGRIKNILGYKKPTFWLGAMLALVVIISSIGLLTNPSEDATPRKGAEALWQNRTFYVGNNSAVGNIIMQLSFPEGMYYDGFELFTTEHPYGVDVKLKTNAETRNAYTGALNEAPFQRNAIIMFSLIENAELINFTLDDGANPYSLGYTSEWAKDFMTVEDLFQRTETYAGFGELVKEISAKISAQVEEVLQREKEQVLGTGGAGYEPDLLAGYMFIERDILHFNKVEIIGLGDEDRIAELGLDIQSDLPSGYYIHNPVAEPETYMLTGFTTYTFTDFDLLFVEDADGDRLYTTTSKEEFLEGSSYRDVPLEEQKVPYFVEIGDGRVISIMEKFIYTQ